MFKNDVKDFHEQALRNGAEAAARAKNTHEEMMRGMREDMAVNRGKLDRLAEEKQVREYERQMQQDQFQHERNMQRAQQQHELRMQFLRHGGQR